MISVREVEIRDKKVFLRVDFNVPLSGGKVSDTNRIKAALTTIKYLIDNGAKIILASHLGDPSGEFKAEFSLLPVAEELSKLLKRKVAASDHVIGQIITDKVAAIKSGDLFLLGNLRFDAREEANDVTFAKELAALADIYVNDAFASCHRAHASIDAITRYLPSYSGFLLESEVETLKLLLANPVRPFIVISGGAKVKDKAPLIKNLAEKADLVLIGGAVATNFLAAKGLPVSESLYDKDLIPICKEILEQFSDKIILPQDQVKEDLGDGNFSIMDIGQYTVDKFVHEISGAKTIFWNGNMGKSEDSRYEKGTLEVAKAVYEIDGTAVVAGGDTVNFINNKGFADGIDFISTGGGATLQFLAGEAMPGLLALDSSAKRLSKNESDLS